MFKPAVDGTQMSDTSNNDVILDLHRDARIGMPEAVLCTSKTHAQINRAVDQALAKNISIQQNKLGVALAKRDVAIAKGNFLPNLNGNTGGNLNFIFMLFSLGSLFIKGKSS